MSKGSGRRPSRVSEESVQREWDRIFNDGVPDTPDCDHEPPPAGPLDPCKCNEPKDSAFRVGTQSTRQPISRRVLAYHCGTTAGYSSV